MKKLLLYFSKFEIMLWSLSVLMILVSFFIFDRENYLTLSASLIGITSLIFCAKGNPFGQVLMIVFCLFYGWISLSFSYYGEMLTYLGMSLPMAVFALISWLRNPYKGNRAQVKINTLKKNEPIFLCLLTLAVSIAFYFILKYFHTANLLPSTLSVATSFVAAYLTFRRSPWFAFAYAANDVVLIVLWIMASLEDPFYISVVVCFIAFLFHDLYGFVSWQRMKAFQRRNS